MHLENFGKLGIILLKLKTLGAGLEETTKLASVIFRTFVSQYSWIVLNEINISETVF